MGAEDTPGCCCLRVKSNHRINALKSVSVSAADKQLLLLHYKNNKTNAYKLIARETFTQALRTRLAALNLGMLLLLLLLLLLLPLLVMLLLMLVMLVMVVVVVLLLPLLLLVLLLVLLLLLLVLLLLLLLLLLLIID